MKEEDLCSVFDFANSQCFGISKKRLSVAQVYATRCSLVYSKLKDFSICNRKSLKSNDSIK